MSLTLAIIVSTSGLAAAPTAAQTPTTTQGDTTWHEDATRPRLFFGPTARPAGHGVGHAGIQTVIFAVVGMGIGDRVTLGAGTLILPFVVGDAFFVSSKVTMLNSERVQLAVGAFSGFVTEEIDEGSAGILYGVGTFGSSDNAITIGAGWGFALARDDSAISDEPLLMLGLEHRASRGIKLISENYVAGGNLLLSGGLRVIGERFAADMGLGGRLEGNDLYCCIPIVSVVLRF